MKNIAGIKYLLFAACMAVLAVSCKDKSGEPMASGTFEADEITVSAEASGKLVSFTADEGMTVSAGQVVGQIDSLSLYLNKELIERNIAALEAGRPDVEAQLGVMEAQLESGKHELERLSRLLESDAATQKQFDDAEASVRVLEKQIEWALEFDLPLILHCRKAYPELISVLSAYKRTTLYGIFHSFTGGDGDSIFLPELLDFSSFMLGINGVVTFKKSVLPELLQNNIPLGRVVLETDSPYLSPVPYRGKRNESAYVAKVAEKLSEIYGETPEKIVQTTLQNALTIFRKVKMYF